jgi:hypothetical protein
LKVIGIVNDICERTAERLLQKSGSRKPLKLFRFHKFTFASQSNLVSLPSQSSSGKPHCLKTS